MQNKANNIPEAANDGEAVNENDSDTLHRIEVPGEGSCLFLSIDYLINGGKLDLDSPGPMRKIVADAIRKDPAKYKDDIPDGSSAEDYCDWIMKTTTWGGRMELKILAQHFGVEIAALYIHKKRFRKMHIIKRNYQNRILLIYTGIHYNPLRASKKTMFLCSDKAIMDKGLEQFRST